MEDVFSDLYLEGRQTSIVPPGAIEGERVEPEAATVKEVIIWQTVDQKCEVGSP